MNKLPLEKRVQIIRCLVEGNSIRATARIADCSKNTVAKLLAEVGEACQSYQDKHLRKLSCKRLQVDEIWSFCYAKQANVAKAKAAPEGAGDVWTWTAICAETKLVPSWLVGSRDAGYANAFISDLADRLASRVQLTSDGHHPYVKAVQGAFGVDVDYAQLVKTYGPEPEAIRGRYSPAICNGAKRKKVTGNPEWDHVSTSFVERQNLTMRMHMRRFTRLTNGFTKKIENHSLAVALHFMYYNFARIHTSLRVSPAMAAGVTQTLWDVDDIVKMADAYWAEKNPPKKRGPYKTRT